MAAHSFFTVLCDGQPIHSETADVKLLNTSVDTGVSDIDCIFYYTAPLVPTFWNNICQDHGELFSLHGDGRLRRTLVPQMSLLWINHPLPTDPARYSIIHDIYQHSGPAAESSSAPEQGYLILSVEYQFTYPESPYSSPQLSPIDSLSSTGSSLPSPLSYNNVSCLPYLPRN
jgi:hypothetical protein